MLFFRPLITPRQCRNLRPPGSLTTSMPFVSQFHRQRRIMDPAWPVLRCLVSLGGQNITPYYCCCLLFISHELIRYKSSRGHKIDGTKPNQTGTRSEKSRESRQKTTDNTVVASKRHRRHVGRDTEETENKNKNVSTRNRNTNKSTHKQKATT